MAETEIIIRPQQKSAAENSASAGGAAKQPRNDAKDGGSA